MALGERLRLARKAKGLTQMQLAIKTGMSQAGINALEARNSAQTRYAPQLAKALGVDPNWLAFGQGESGLDSLTYAGRGLDYPQQQLRTTHLPVYGEVELSAGSGSTQVAEVPDETVEFSLDELRRCGVSNDTAVICYVTGNSMEPILPDGSKVGVDTADTRIRDGKAYAIEQEGMLRIKYAYRKPGGGLILKSANRDEHPDEDYTSEQVANEIRVIGRVFWSAAYW